MNSSGRVRVLIGTSDGPAEILWLRREGQAVRRSQVTVGGSTKDAGISRGYDAFVARRTGVIQRLFDDSRAYRAEVSAKIDAGSSWQLGFFVAHALAASDRLAASGQARNVTLWATGRVRTDDLSVGGIGYLARKLTSSLAILKAAAATGERVIVTFPAGNADQPSSSLRNELLSIGVEIVEAETIVDVVRKLGLPAIALAADAVLKPWTGSPFLGLESFQPQHRDVFFGRDRAREETLERLRDAAKGEFAFLLVYGRSGCGKSSLVRAGLVGDVAIQAAEADLWRSCILSPGLSGNDPLAGLIAALANALPEVSASLLQAVPGALVALVQQVLGDSAKGKPCKLLLVIDQLEELLTIDFADRREAFAESIATLAASGAVWVVATLRSDFLPAVKESPALSRLCSDDRMYWLERPNRTELRDIIRRPAAAARLRYEGSDPSGQPLAEVLIDAAAASLDSLPLLQFMLARMFAIEGAKGRLSYDVYATLGRLEGAIGQWAEDSVAKLISSGVSELTIDQVVLGLGRIERATRAVVARLDETVSSAPDRERVLEALTQARLITLDHEGKARVAHEAVLTHWTRAKSLFEANAHELEMRDLIEAEAAKWDNEGRALDFLIPPGRRLVEAELLFTNNGLLLSTAGQAFVDASIAESNRLANEERIKAIADIARQRRRTRLALVGIAAITILSTVALVFGYLAKNERDQSLLAQSRFLARDSRAATEAGEPMLGKLLALQAIPRALDRPDRPFLPEAQSALQYAFETSRELLQLRGHRKLPNPRTEIVRAIFSPDGTHIATSSNDRTIRIWDSKTGRETAVIATDLLGAYMFFRKDGRLAVINQHASEIRDPVSGQQLMRLERPEECSVDTSIGHNLLTTTSLSGEKFATTQDGLICVWDTIGNAVNLVRFPGQRISLAKLSPAGDQLVVVNSKGGAALIDLRDGRTLAAVEEGVTDAKFSHKGKLLALASLDSTTSIRDASNGRLLQTITGHTRPVQTLDFSPDDSILATGADDGNVRLWNSSDGSPYLIDRMQEQSMFQADPDIRSVAFSGDGRFLLVRTPRRPLLYYVQTGELLALGEPNNLPTIVEMSSDGRLVVSYSPDDYSMRIWETSGYLSSVMLIATLKVSASDTAALSISPDGRRIVTASDDAIARVWTAEVKHKPSFEWHDHSATVGSVLFTNSGLVITAGGNSISVRDRVTGELRKSIKQRGEGKIRQAVLGPNDALMMTVTDWGTMRIWRLADGQLIASDGEGDKQAEEADGFDLEKDRRKDRYATVPEQRRIEVPRPRTATVLSSSDHRFAAAFASRFDGSRNTEVWISVRNMVDGSERVKIGGWHGSATCAAFSRDGRYFAAGFLDGTLIVADLEEQKVVAEHGSETSTGFSGAVLSVLFARNGQSLIAAIGDGTVLSVDARGATYILDRASRRSHGFVSLTPSPDGLRFVTSGLTTSRLWSSRGKLLANLDPAGNERAFFSPDGSRLITANSHMGILWDTATGLQLATLSTNLLSLFGFTDDGSYIVGSLDWHQNLFLWDGHTGQPIARLSRMAGDDLNLTHTANISSDGSLAAAGGDEGSVTIWQMPQRCQPLIDAAVSSVPRELSIEERNRYFLSPTGGAGLVKWITELRPFRTAPRAPVTCLH